MQYTYSLPDYATDFNDSNEDDGDEIGDTVNENISATTSQISHGHDTDIGLDYLSVNEPNISPQPRQQSDRKRIQARSDARKKISKTTRITRQSTHTSLLPDLTDIWIQTTI